MVTFKDIIGISDTALKSGLNYLPCPVCSKGRKKENAKPLTVNVEEGNRWYKCHHCHLSGNLEVHERYSKVRESARMPKTIKMYSPKVREYIQSRGLSMATYLNDGVYEALYNGKNILGYPVKISHTLVNVKFRDLDWTKESKFPKFWQVKKDDGAKSCFIGLDSLELPKDHDIDRKPNVVIIVEGQDDRLTLKECGFKNVLSVPSGAPSLTSEKYEREFDYVTETYFNNINKNLIDVFILFVDNDPAGEKLKSHLSTILGKHRCKYVKYPEGYKDANEVYVGHGKFMKPLTGSYIRSMVETAKPFPVGGIVDPEEIEVETETYRINGYRKGYEGSIKKLNSLFTLKRPYLYVLTGIPGIGKTTWLRWYMIDLIREVFHVHQKSLKFAWWSPESRPKGREMSKMIESIVGKPIYSGSPGCISDQEYKNAKNFIKNHIIYMFPETKRFDQVDNMNRNQMERTLSKILENLTHLVRAYGISGYVIDPWNSIHHKKAAGETIEDYYARILETLHSFNELYNLVGFIVAHPTNDIKKLTSGNFERAGLHKISGGAMWKNKVDVGITIHRKPWVQVLDAVDEDGANIYEYDDNAPTQIIVDKMKFEEIGRYGGIDMHFDQGKYYCDKSETSQGVIDFEHTEIESEIDIEKLLEDKHGNLPF